MRKSNISYVVGGSSSAASATATTTVRSVVYLLLSVHYLRDCASPHTTHTSRRPSQTPRHAPNGKRPPAQPVIGPLVCRGWGTLPPLNIDTVLSSTPPRAEPKPTLPYLLRCIRGRRYLTGRYLRLCIFYSPSKSVCMRIRAKYCTRFCYSRYRIGITLTRPEATVLSVGPAWQRGNWSQQPDNQQD